MSWTRTILKTILPRIGRICPYCCKYFYKHLLLYCALWQKMIRTYFPTPSISSLIFFRLQYPIILLLLVHSQCTPSTIHDSPHYTPFINLHLPTPFCMNGYFIHVKNELVSYTPSYFTSLAYKTPPPLKSIPPLYILYASLFTPCLPAGQLFNSNPSNPILILLPYSYLTILFLSYHPILILPLYLKGLP